MKPQEIIQLAPDAVVGLDAGAIVRAEAHGARAHILAQLTRLGLPVPPGVALSFDCVRALAGGGPMPKLPAVSNGSRLLCLRPSPLERSWGGPDAMLNIGITSANIAALETAIGVLEARELYARLISTYALAVHGVDPEGFESIAQRILGPGPRRPETMRATTDEMLSYYAEETDEQFPDIAADQLESMARAMARAWDRPSARILRQAKGAPAEGGLGLVVQELALGQFEAAAARGERGGLFVEWFVKPRHADAAQFEHVAKAARGDQRGLSALAFEDGVGRDGRGVKHFGEAVVRNAQFGGEAGNALEDRAGIVVGGGGQLACRQHGIGREAGDVGEGAADVGGEAVAVIGFRHRQPHRNWASLASITWIPRPGASSGSMAPSFTAKGVSITSSS